MGYLSKNSDAMGAKSFPQKELDPSNIASPGTSSALSDREELEVGLEEEEEDVVAPEDELRTWFLSIKI